MKASNGLWQERLAGKIPETLAREIDIFETEIALRKQGKLDERLFAETRLRRGTYGQRYDNGQRHDGTKVQKVAYPSGDLTKGPSTMWDAPGMQRIKIPFGGLNAAQLETMAELAEEYSDGIAHVTTRQDFQLHYIQIDDTPSLMRRLGAANITTREACGNSVRNVTACPYAGVCPDEAFDVTPFARALAKFLLGHPDCQNFGRKFKPAFSGCAQHACGLTSMHDLGLIAATRNENGEEKRGFAMYVGGGLGAVPYQAKLFDPFIPPEELLPLAQAIARVFGRLGEKKNRARARIKFLIQDLGIEKFRELVLEERKLLPGDPRWTEYLKDIDAHQESPLKKGGERPLLGTEAFQRWVKVIREGRNRPGTWWLPWRCPSATLPPTSCARLPISRGALREKRFARPWSKISFYAGSARATCRNCTRRCKPRAWALPGRKRLSISRVARERIPCKLGISSSRGLAAELRKRLGEKSFAFDQAVENLHIKISGCFNSCGQHHVADLGFYGVSRKIAGYAVPHFQVVLGGEWSHNGGSYGMPVMAIPSKHIPEVVSRLLERYATGRQDGDMFKDFIKRMGKTELKTLLEDLARPPADPADRSIFTDWGDPREYGLGDMGIGECAGEVVSPTEFELAGAEREVFEAQVAWDNNDFNQAGKLSYQAMLHAATGLIKLELPDVLSDPDGIINEFRVRFYDTQKFFDPFAGGKFAQYLLPRTKNRRNRKHPIRRAI